MKRQQAFVKEGTFLKGGLHCHTTRSDSKLTPEETLRYAASQGYDFMALTDHQIYNFVNYAPETGILVIPGMEYANDLEHGRGYRCFHTVCIGPEKDRGNGFNHDDQFPWGYEPDSDAYQPMLDEMHRKNNLTILCHPQWSNTSAKYFETQQGNFAMEIYNSGCDILLDCDNDAAYWDELLGKGIRWYGVATDDAHGIDHLCKGWVMVKAEKNVESILEALEKGEFYSSCGPEIYDFYVKDGKAVIDCSPAAMVRVHCDKHNIQAVRDSEGKITHAEFDIATHWSGPYAYARISVTDTNGKKAWTNPIFIEEDL